MNHKKRVTVVLSGILLCMSLLACKMPQIRITGTSYPTTPNSGASAGLGAALNPDGSIDEEATRAAQSAELVNPEGYAYQNAFFNVACTVPEGWHVYNEDERNILAGVVDEMSDGSKLDGAYQKALDSGTSVFDFYADSEDQTQSINIIVSKTSVLEMLFSENQMLQFAINPTLDLLENSGMENLSDSIETVSFLGKNHNVLKIQGEYPDTPVFEELVYLRRGPFIAVITVSSVYDDSNSALLGYWGFLN